MVPWCHLRLNGSSAMYLSESCIQPMFHLIPKPRPPWLVGAVTPGNAVDSSAIMTAPGCVL